MMNGEVAKQRTQAESDIAFGAPARIGALVKEPKAIVDAAYQCILSRKPTQEERESLVKHLEGKNDAAKREAIEDLFWILVNSSEFSWNH